MKQKISPVAAAAISLLCVASGAPILAQDSVAALEEVVVTARREEERLLDVPIAITAFTANDIEERGIRNLDDIAANTPGLTFSNLIGEFLPTPVIRGIAPVAVNNENNAAIFVDGAYVAGREGLNFSQLDIERVEVLKGPQAATYGRNAFSGAISYTTAKPTDEFKGKAEVTGGSDGRRMFQGSLSGPLIGNLYGRIALLKDEFDGTYDNQFPGSNSRIGGYDYTTLQGSLRWQASESFEAILTGYWSDDHIDVSSLSSVAANCEDRRVASPTMSARFLNFCGELPSINSDSLYLIPEATGEERDVQRANLNLKWAVGSGTLTSISSYSNVEQSFFEDGSRGALGGTTFSYIANTPPQVPVPGLGTAGPPRLFQADLLQIGPGVETEEISEEIRWSASVGERFRYAVGAYWYNTEARETGDGVVATSSLPADFRNFCPCISLGPTLAVTPSFLAFGNATFLPWFTNPTGDAIFDFISEEEIEALAGFGYAEWDFAQGWTARVEGRWTREERTARDLLGNEEVDNSWSFPSWRTTLTYKPADNWTLYAGVAEAEKSGGFDSGAVVFQDMPGVTQVVNTTFDGETLLSYELGAKASLADGRVRVEGDVYFSQWKDVIIPRVVEAIDGRPIVTPTSFDVNAGEATIFGVEFTAEARVNDWLKVNVGAAWSDAEWDDARIDSFILFPTYAPDGDISGNRILRQSEWQANAGGTLELPFGAAASVYLRSDLAYRGKQFADNSNQTIVPQNLLLNAAIGVRNDNLTLELWGRNLTHEDAPTGAFRDVYFSNYAPGAPATSSFGSAGQFFPFRYTVSHPRLTTYGVSFRWRF